MPSMAEEFAKYTAVDAPCSGVFKPKSFISPGLRPESNGRLVYTAWGNTNRINSVSTMPGCIQFTVTGILEDVQRRASSWEKSQLAGFDCPYVGHSLYSAKSYMNSSRMTKMFVYPGEALDLSLSSNSAVSRKWPKWFTPSWYSKPSTVNWNGHAINPALFTWVNEHFRHSWRVHVWFGRVQRMPDIWTIKTS